jgi:hypothetical protein
MAISTMWGYFPAAISRTVAAGAVPVTAERGRDVVPFGAAVRAWFAISLQTFGGPAGQIAVMQRALVDEHRWIGQRRFLHALSYCMLLPGPEADQLAIYVGWLLNGLRGGLVAGVLFVLPGMVALLALSALYVGDVLAAPAQQPQVLAPDSSAGPVSPPAANAAATVAPGSLCRCEERAHASALARRRRRR